MNRAYQAMLFWIGGAAIGLTFPCPLARADSFTVPAWDMGVGASSSSDDSIGAGFFEVMNPFVNQHSVQLPSDPQTWAAAQYNISWLTDYPLGSFNISAQSQVAGQASTSVQAGASGNIFLAPTQPLPIHIAGQWSYSFEASFMMTQFGVAITGQTSHAIIFHQSYTRTTFPGDPWSDTLPIDGDVVLSPEETWLVQYSFNLRIDRGLQGYGTQGEGYVSFQISPEPATLALLAPVLVAIPRRAGRRRLGPT